MADFPVTMLRKEVPLGLSRSDQDAQSRLGQPIHTERQVKIICVGAGASGLLLAYKVQRHFDNVELVVYEKNPEVSGTWYENRYPGCACDVPAHNYTWSFEPKLDWSAVYASSKEIFDYFNDFADKYDLRKFIRTNHQVVAAHWQGGLGGYAVAVRDTQTNEETHDQCDILINASGILNNWRWPALPGLSEFEGPLVHTANWDASVELRGKRVGLIGNGSSGIQLLPSIQPHVEHVTTFIRSPTWVSPVQGLEQHVYTDEERRSFKEQPGALTEYRKNVERGLNGAFALFLKDSSTNLSTREYMTEQMKARLGNNGEHSEKLIPPWSVGCRRLTPGVGYLEALVQPNVTPVYGEIERVTPRGCIADHGQAFDFDVLICATGFDTTFKPRFPLTGAHGQNLQDEWAAEPRSYLGIAAAGYPNYLTFLGPNCPIGNGPVLCAVEAQADYMCRLIDHYQSHNVKSFTPKKAAVDDFVAHKEAFMQRTVWNDPCRSWYKGGRVDGPITALWPGSALHYIEAVMTPRMEDYEVEYAGNRFAWLGNGYSQTEVDETADWAYYIREQDDDRWLSRGRRRRELTKTGQTVRSPGVSYFGAPEQEAAKAI